MQILKNETNKYLDNNLNKENLIKNVTNSIFLPIIEIKKNENYLNGKKLKIIFRFIKNT